MVKIRIYKFELSIGKDDAACWMPFLLLVTTLIFSNFEADTSIAIAVTYYFLYFYVRKLWRFVKNIFSQCFVLKCRKCGSRKIQYQGDFPMMIGNPNDPDSYRSEAVNSAYVCLNCGVWLKMTEGGLYVDNN